MKEKKKKKKENERNAKGRKLKEVFTVIIKIIFIGQPREWQRPYQRAPPPSRVSVLHPGPANVPVLPLYLDLYLP